MAGKSDVGLSRRERQIMDVVYTKGQATVAEVHRAISDRPSYSSIRALMRILEEKGHLKHTQEGVKYMYLPTRSREEASRSAAKRLVQTFFEGSTEQAVAALLKVSGPELNDETLERLAQLIKRARKEGR